MAPPANLQYPYKDGHFLKVPKFSGKIYALTHSNPFIPLPYQETYRRVRTNWKGKKYEHIFKVCTNSTMKKDCGKWINVANNKTVPFGKTTFDTYFGSPMIWNIKKYDAGVYMTGDRKHSIQVVLINGIL